MAKKHLLLTIDLEEFDLPLEYGLEISKKEQFEISKKGLLRLLDLFKKHKIKATFFTTTNFGKKYPKEIKKIAKDHEIAYHGFSHSDNCKQKSTEYLLKGKKELEKIINKKIKGFRAPRFECQPYELIKKLKINYSSNLHPTWIPGRYNNIFKKRQIFKREGIKEIPISVMPIIRLPLSWLFFRNIPLIFTKLGVNLNTKYFMIYFHPWEFVNLSHLKIPKYIKKVTGKESIKKVEKFLIWCNKKDLKSTTISEYLN